MLFFASVVITVLIKLEALLNNQTHVPLFLNSIMEEPTLGEQLVVLLLLPAMIMMLPLMNMVKQLCSYLFSSI